jgi:hypothetical protein
VSPVKYELGFYIPEDDILHSHCRESFKSYITQAVRRYNRFRIPSLLKMETVFASES